MLSPCHLCFNTPSQWFLHTLKFEKFSVGTARGRKYVRLNKNLLCLWFREDGPYLCRSTERRCFSSHVFLWTAAGISILLLSACFITRCVSEFWRSNSIFLGNVRSKFFLAACGFSLPIRSIYTLPFLLFISRSFLKPETPASIELLPNFSNLWCIFNDGRFSSPW